MLSWLFGGSDRDNYTDQTIEYINEMTDRDRLKEGSKQIKKAKSKGEDYSDIVEEVTQILDRMSK